VTARRGGFTLLELLIAVTLTLVLVLMTARWVVTTSSVSVASRQSGDVTRQVQLVRGTLTTDLLRAQPCDPQRKRSPLGEMTATALVVYADDNRDGDVDTITYRQTGSRLTRAVRFSTGGCAAPGGLEATVTDRLANTPSNTPWAPVVDGGALLFKAGGWPATQCTSQPASCNFHAVSLNLLLDNSADGQRTGVVRDVVPLNWQASTSGTVQVSSVRFAAGGVTALVANGGSGVLPGEDVDVSMLVAPRAGFWPPASTQTIVSACSAASCGWAVSVTPAQTLVFRWQDRAGATHALTSDAPAAFVAGQSLYVRVSFDSRDTLIGGTPATASFWSSVDGVSWAQIGTTRAFGTASSLRVPQAAVAIGGDLEGASQQFIGDVSQVLIAGASNMLPRSGFDTDTDLDGLADGWTASSSGFGAAGTSGALLSGGADGGTYQTVSHDAAGRDIGVRTTVTGIVQPNTTYTLSFFARGSADGVPLGVPMRGWFGSANSDGAPASVSNPGLGAEWQRYEFQVTTPSVLPASPVEVIIETAVGVTAPVVDIDNVQLEEGTRVTNWAPTEHVSADPSDPQWFISETLLPVVEFRSPLTRPALGTATGGVGETWLVIGTATAASYGY
jgi:type II secretory pathway component PulJ